MPDERSKRGPLLTGDRVSGCTDRDHWILWQPHEGEPGWTSSCEHEAHVDDPVEKHGDDLVGMSITDSDVVLLAQRLKDHRDGTMGERHVNCDAHRRGAVVP